MATRFWLANYSGAPAVSPTPDAGWEQTGQVERLRLIPKGLAPAVIALANGSTKTVPITTTQDILGYQFVSDWLPPQRITGTFSGVIRVFENANTNNVSLAIVTRVVNDDGTVRGTLDSTFNTGTEFPLTASAATRIRSATAVTALTTLPGDRLVVEIGGHAAAPTAAGSYTMRLGNNAASDFALTAALTTDLNPWVEFSDLLVNALNNFESPRADGGLSVTERAGWK